MAQQEYSLLKNIKLYLSGSKENEYLKNNTQNAYTYQEGRNLLIFAVYVCVCVCVCVFTSIHLEGFICLGLEVQGTHQRCCVEDVFFLCQVPSTILQYESPSLSN